MIRHRQGRDAVAASFVLRDLAGEGLSRWPRRGEIARAARAPSRARRSWSIRKRGADLRREMKWLGSYRYGVVNLGAAHARGALRGLSSGSSRDIAFHPARARGAQAFGAMSRGRGGPTSGRAARRCSQAASKCGFVIDVSTWSRQAPSMKR